MATRQLSLGGPPTVTTQPVGQPTPYSRPAGQPVNQPAPQVPPTGLIGSEDALRRGLASALSGIETGLSQAGDTLSPYMQGGSSAFDLQAALSGAMGPEAQAQAYANYMESPGTDYLRQQGERAILRNAAATGGLQGGNVLQALQQHGIGLAAQDFGNSFNRLGSLSSMGQSSANLLGGLQASGGFKAGDYGYGTGTQLAAGRTRAGEQIAGTVGSTTSALANLINQQGGDLTNLLGSTSGNLANLLAGSGRDQSQSYQALAALLANIATGSGSQVAGLPGLPGVQPTQGMLGDLGKLLGGGAALYTAVSDIRLKTNIQKIGKTEGGNNLYSWDWNEEGRRIAGDQPTVGVIAQEVPDAAFMGSDGYLVVDYSRVS